MPISEKAMELENRSIGANGAPTLGAAYELLRDQWQSGERERELALHLMFLAWYAAIGRSGFDRRLPRSGNERRCCLTVVRVQPT